MKSQFRMSGLDSRNMYDEFTRLFSRQYDSKLQEPEAMRVIILIISRGHFSIEPYTI